MLTDKTIYYVNLYLQKHRGKNEITSNVDFNQQHCTVGGWERGTCLGRTIQ